MTRVPSFSLFGAALLVTACSPSKSDDGSSSPPPSSCEGAMTHLCERVCACNTPGCHWQSGSAGTLGGFTSQKGCTDWFLANECKSGGTAGFDYGKCSAAVDSAECAAHPTAGKALRYPKECPGPP